jgi:hypothetical protein
MVTETRIIAASYPNAADAQSAVEDLRFRGFPEHDISVVYTDTGHTVRAGLLSGAIWGGVLGALFGLLFPPFGLLVAAGPVVGALASGAVVGTTGALTVGGLSGLISALVHLGMPQEMATGLGERVHKGDTLVLAHTTSPQAADQAEQALQAHQPRANVIRSDTASPAAAGR